MVAYVHSRYPPPFLSSPLFSSPPPSPPSRTMLEVFFFFPPKGEVMTCACDFFFSSVGSSPYTLSPTSSPLKPSLPLFSPSFCPGIGFSQPGPPFSHPRQSLFSFFSPRFTAISARKEKVSDAPHPLPFSTWKRSPGSFPCVLHTSARVFLSSFSFFELAALGRYWQYVLAPLFSFFFLGVPKRSSSIAFCLPCLAR